MLNPTVGQQEVGGGGRRGGSCYPLGLKMFLDEPAKPSGGGGRCFPTLLVDTFLASFPIKG